MRTEGFSGAAAEAAGGTASAMIAERKWAEFRREGSKREMGASVRDVDGRRLNKDWLFRGRPGGDRGLVPPGKIPPNGIR